MGAAGGVEDLAVVEPPDLMTPPWRRKLRDVFGVDMRSLAAFRIAIATLILVDLAMRLPYIEMNYTDRGILPRTIPALFKPLLAPHLSDGSYGYALFLFVVSAVFAALMLVGFHARLAALAS